MTLEVKEHGSPGAAGDVCAVGRVRGRRGSCGPRGRYGDLARNLHRQRLEIHSCIIASLFFCLSNRTNMCMHLEQL